MNNNKCKDGQCLIAFKYCNEYADIVSEHKYYESKDEI